MDLEQLKMRRLQSWCQNGIDRVPDPTAAAQFINRQGIVTHYSASPEVPNLFWAYVSEEGVKGVPEWNSPSGEVYTWRWDLGRADAAFYGALVAKKPTWISYEILPLVLCFAMDRRDPDELYADGQLSNGAIRVIRAFEGTSGTLSTKELRQRAGFPTGKAERAAYLKAVEELDSHMFLAKTFDVGGEGDDMSHSLVRIKYAKQVDESLALHAEEALQKFLARYITQSIYLDPKVFGKHLRLDAKLLNDAIENLVSAGLATRYEGLVVSTND